MTSMASRINPSVIVVDRERLADRVEAIASGLSVPIAVARYTSVLEVVGEQGPAHSDGVVCSATAAGPFLQDLLRWTDREHRSRIPAAVVGTDADENAVNVVLGRDHASWVSAAELEEKLGAWLSMAYEVHDLRAFRKQHDDLATQLREARNRLFYGELEAFTPAEGPPCGPPLPTTIEEIQPLRDARAQFERGLIRAAIRECGSLKEASALLGISYTSLWRRLR